ncbi:MAG TPA: fumarylacetoacetate hydrolase family protein [Steroidobacteraceae bacterium]|nr:fumarylacetoacetate hydrolase family protein [Steroidobacteraceae bacterium]
MKLVRFGSAGAERPGLVLADGSIADLSGVIPDLAGAALEPASLKKLSAVDAAKLPKAPGGVRLGACVGGVGKFIAIGLNYADHAAETGAKIPAEPIVFMKATSCIVGPNDTVLKPRGSIKMDWEVELGVVIGSVTRYVSEADAPNHIAGYCVINDLSERHFQLERGGQWDKGKGCDTFGPLGPWLVTSDEVGDPANLSMWLDVNGTRRQNGSTRTMIFKPAFLVSYLSQFMSLQPGDVITTGTPPGVGMGIKPEPIFLNVGDVMELGIEKLGSQRQVVAAA